MRFPRSLFTLVILAGSPLFGADPAGSSDLVTVVTKAPALAAAAHKASAAQERLGASGRLGDLQVEAMASRMVGAEDERAQMWELTVSQPLPKKGERAADRQKAQARVSMAQADYAVMAGDLAADTAMALAESSGSEARIRLLRIQIERLHSVLRSLEVRLSAGAEGRIAERLTIQTRMASMQLMIEEETKMAADALAEAKGRLGMGPDEPLPPYVAPKREDIIPEEAAVVKLAVARANEASAMIRMASASANPMTSVGVRFARERNAMGNEDTLGIAFMSELPWRNRRYARHEVRAAQAERAAAVADASAVKHRIASTLTRVGRAEALAQTSRRLSNDTLTRLNAEYDAMVRSAGVGGGMAQSTILELVELLEKATEAEIQIIRAETAVQVARSELWRYMPISYFPLPTN